MSKNNRKKEKKGGLHGKSDPLYRERATRNDNKAMQPALPPVVYNTYCTTLPFPPSPSQENSPLGQHGLIVNSFTVSDDFICKQTRICLPSRGIDIAIWKKLSAIKWGKKRRERKLWQKSRFFLLPETGDDSVKKDNLTCHPFSSMINLVYRKTNRCVYRPHI